jgi:hypothetical protein
MQPEEQIYAKVHVSLAIGNCFKSRDMMDLRKTPLLTPCWSTTDYEVIET